MNWLFLLLRKERNKISKTIYIRNVDAGVLAKIDEIAEKKGISRNKCVNAILEDFIFTDKINKTENMYADLVLSTTNAINNLVIAVHQLTNQTNSNKKEEYK